MKSLLFGALAAIGLTTASADAGCLLDETPEELVGTLVSTPQPERPGPSYAVLRLAVLSEVFAPGSAETLLDVPIMFSKDKATMTIALPMVQMLAAGEWDKALTEAKSHDQGDLQKMAEALLPVLVSMSGQYELLHDLYPLGEGTYFQNLKVSDATRVALQAGRFAQAVDIFADHKFGNHTGRKYGDLMRGLLNNHATEQAHRLTEVVRRGLADYEAEGGLSLCLERSDMTRCEESAAEHPEMARLSAFDGGAYANCFFQHKQDGATTACLAGLRQKADAAGFALTEGAPVPDGITGPVYLELWGFQALMGDPQPDEIPDEVFREMDISTNILHGRILAAMGYAGREAELQAYIARLEAPQPRQTPSLLNGFGSESRAQVAEFTDWAYLSILAMNGESRELERLSNDPNLPENLQRDALTRLAQLALYRGDGKAALAAIQSLDPAPGWLLKHAQRQRLDGHDHLADDLVAELRRRVCAPDAALSDRDQRGLIARLLMQHAVDKNGLPPGFLRH